MSHESTRRSREDIFIEAAEITDPKARAEYLDRVCADDQLRAEVEALLRHDRDAGSFLEKPPEELIPKTTTARSPNADSQIEKLLSAGGEDCADESWRDLLATCEIPERLGMLGKYEVMDLVGQGGMGVVLRAFDPKLNRIVAIKLLAPELAAQSNAIQRFLREARAAAAVSHHHVVSIYAIEDDAKPPMIVMEMIDGQSLQQKIDSNGALDVKSILRIGMQTAAGLSAAHRQGLIHRDIKPANILLENGIEKVKLTDFGLARAVDDVGITRTGQVTGTPQYMSPEQAQGHPVDHRTDLFSLGCVLYAMCTGRAAFRAESAVAVMHRIVHETPQPIKELNDDIPDWLEAITFKLLAKNTEERFQTAQEVAVLLEEHLAHLQHPLLARQPKPVIPPEPAQNSRTAASFGRSNWNKRHLTLSLLVAAVAVSLVLLAAFFQASRGTVVIESEDPSVEIAIHRVRHHSVGDRIPGGIQMHTDLVQPGQTVKGSGTIRLAPGTYFAFAPGARDRVDLNQYNFTLSRRGRVVIRVTRKP